MSTLLDIPWYSWCPAASWFSTSQQLQDPESLRLSASWMEPASKTFLKCRHLLLNFYPVHLPLVAACLSAMKGPWSTWVAWSPLACPSLNQQPLSAPCRSFPASETQRIGGILYRRVLRLESPPHLVLLWADYCLLWRKFHHSGRINSHFRKIQHIFKTRG